MKPALALGAGPAARLAAPRAQRLRAGGCAAPRAASSVLTVVARRGGRADSGGRAAWRGKAAGRAASAAVADAPSSRPLDSVVASSAAAPPPPPPPAAAEGETLGAFAHELLQRRLRKAAKLHKRALRQAADGEGLGKDAVREVRVALRRLRNTLTGVEKALVLPPAAAAKQLTPALRALGQSRDAEAVSAVIAAAAATAAADGALPPAEAAVLASMQRVVEARYAAGAVAAARALSGRRVQRALAALEALPATPDTRKLAARPAAEGAARQLLHAVVNLLAHDAWEMEDLGPREEGGDAAAKAAAAARQPLRAPRRAPWEHALRVARRRCETLHGLRKAIREVRYMMEAYAPLYAAVPAYSAQVASLAALQAHVGAMRDVEVSLESLPELVGCPALCAALQRTHASAWAAFRAGREPLLAPRGRAALYNAILCVAGAGFGPAGGAHLPPHA